MGGLVAGLLDAEWRVSEVVKQALHLESEGYEGGDGSGDGEWIYHVCGRSCG